MTCRVWRSKENLRHNCATIVRVLRHNCPAVAQQSPVRLCVSRGGHRYFRPGPFSLRTRLHLPLHPASSPSDPGSDLLSLIHHSSPSSSSKSFTHRIAVWGEKFIHCAIRAWGKPTFHRKAARIFCMERSLNFALMS